ncbi:MAG: aminoacyl-tRNA hydrolase [Oscillospiraceae bacterium]|nr:aminoacyl-tRNA hydrolase [Oscillospiraceae bacterium]MBR6599172.1 aminoacyl-tRNA hydrolase [Oscillospiraceae bacterium]
MSILDLFNQIQSPTKTGPVEYIIVGLGNPGLQYQDTRHNAGFMAIDTLAKKYNADVKKIKFKSLCGECIINDKKCLLMKPSTYMNNSGEAVVEAMNFYKTPIENVIIIYDDISLEPSKLRIRRKGSDGGHNGIKSIIYLTGEDTFPRIKIGVGKKPHPAYNLADWVLSNFKADEIPLIKEACSNASEAISLMVTGKMNDAMNKFN